MMEDLRDAVNEKKIIIGSKQTIKNLKLKSIKKVFVASNCPENLKKDINYYSKLTGIKVENFNELVAANALYRPGPMGIGAHEEYIKNKYNPNKIYYVQDRKSVV